jgi:methyl-accepting chemotaxis protein
MSLRGKFFSFMGLILAGFVVFAVIAWNTLNTTKVNGPLYQQIVQGKDLIADILPPPEYIIESYFVLFQMMEETDAAKLKELASRSQSLREEYDKRHAFWLKSLPVGALKEMMVVTSYTPARKFYEIRDKEVIPAILGGQKEKVAKLMREVLAPLYAEHRAAIDKVVEMADKGLQREEKSAAAIIGWRSLILTGLGALIIGATLLLGGLYITFGILKPINRTTTAIDQSTDQVAAASAQVSSTSQQQAEGATEQAASIEEASSSLEEMASKTKENLDKAMQANTLMKETSKVVKDSSESMNHLASSMSEISKASEETSKIIKTIDEIAFQTNLLALNAAVEAARAGEAGAGFAVVADEVRNLAMRAADAARNTADLIEGTGKKVKEGSEVVQKTYAGFSQVAEEVSKVEDLVAAITAGSQEQSQGIDQINRAILEMNKVVQRGAASAEESASASEEMYAQAEQMKSQVKGLIALISGKANGGRGRSSAATGIESKPGAALAASQGTKGLESRTDVPANTRGMLGFNAARKETRAHKLIPLDRDEFEEF